MSTARFIPAPPTGTSTHSDKAHSHEHDHSHSHSSHSHDHHESTSNSNSNLNSTSTMSAAAIAHGHEHEILDHPGKFSERDLPDYSGRNWEERAFTIGIGGPVGSGKTALTLALCLALRDHYNIAVVTNDIFTKEDQEFLIRNQALSDKGRIRAIETGGCPHAAIREDVSANIGALEELQAAYGCDMLFVESGGDNLAANYSRELADYIIYVIDVAGGDKVPRKGGPGISQSDLLIVNKIDLAPHVGASLEVMKRDADKMRDGGPTLFTSVRQAEGVEGVIELIKGAWANKGKGKVGK